jgi:hypothetical protein
LIFGSLALAGGLHFMKDLWQPVGKPVTSDIAQRASSSPGESKPKPLPVLKETILPQQKVAAVNAEKAPDPTPAPSTTSTQVPLQATAQTATNTPPPAAPEMPEVHVATATKPEGIHPAAAPEIVAIPVPSTPPSPPAPPLSPSPAASALEPAPPQEEVRRALPSNAATLSISKQDPLPVIAAKLVFGIDSATTPEERARWIADPAKHGTDMEQFVKMHGGRLNTREVESLPTAGPVHALPSGEAVTLFRVNSPNSRGGAMVRLHTTANGNHVIDWPLFAQTYDNAFDRFVAANRISPSEAEWYTVLCNLIADPNTKNAREEPRLMLKVQGSLAKTGVTEAWVDKNSPVGQYLQKKVIYGRTYIVELQFSTSGEDGRHLKVLDCAATKGETAQANANN